jgi:OOP family OmpA-OmpF porin
MRTLSFSLLLFWMLPLLLIAQDTIPGTNPPQNVVFEPFPLGEDFVISQKEETIIITKADGSRDTLRILRTDTIWNPSIEVPDMPGQIESWVPKDEGPSATLTAIFEQLAALRQQIEILKKRNAELEAALRAMEAKSASPGAGSLIEADIILATLRPETVHFALNSSVLDEIQRYRLKGIAGLLKRHPWLGIRVSGYTDASGDPAYNLKLSQKRADQVRNFLVNEMGVPDSQLQTSFQGEENPISGRVGSSRSPIDRRVEIEYFRIP